MTKSSDIQSAQDVHHRLEFYLVAVAFTVAAFAIQTGEFSGKMIGDAAEAASWFLLTTSGLLGLWRLEYIPVMYRVNDFMYRKNGAICDYSAHPEHADSVALLKKQIEEVQPKLELMENRNSRKYFWQKLCFVFGLISLLIARLLGQMSGWYW